MLRLLLLNFAQEKENEQSFKPRLIFTASTFCRAPKLVKVKKLYFVNSTQERRNVGK
jgi:hypothetical protein